jgi:transcriptional regulator with XRE-family HTH domain
VVAWRKLLGLTAAQVADRAGISRGTLARIEHGDGGASLAAFLSAAHALGQLDRVVDSVDPYSTDLGRARADEILPKRVRQ